MLATKTLELIERSLGADNCASFRQHCQELLPKMEDAYRGKEDPFRSHLGVSQIGHDCSFYLWATFRWVQRPQFPERVLRLFQRGHLEEARFLAMFKAAGVQIWYEDENGGQFRISDHGGHFGSAMDGFAQNIPDLPEGSYCVLEMKTHNAKSFAKLVKEGVRSSKLMHFVQMQVYMRKNNDIPYALYCAVCKDTDELYFEIVQLDTQFADTYIERGKVIIFSQEAMPKQSNTPAFFGCKFCDIKEICHGNKVPEINCRTCCHGDPLPDGGWMCVHHKTKLSKEDMMVGCRQHVFNPHLLNGIEFIGGDPDENYSELKLRNGKIIKQGYKHVKSDELQQVINENP